MGWTCYNRSMTKSEALEELRRLHDWQSDDGTRYTVLVDGITGGGDRMGYYAAVRVDEPGKAPHTFAAVCLITLPSFGYKGMSDSMGPCIDNAPLAVLQALDPLPPVASEPCTNCGGTGITSGPGWAEHVQGKPCFSCDGEGKRDRHAWARDWRRRAWARHGGEPQGQQLNLLELVA